MSTLTFRILKFQNLITCQVFAIFVNLRHDTFNNRKYLLIFIFNFFKLNSFKTNSREFTNCQINSDLKNYNLTGNGIGTILYLLYSLV